MSLFLVGQDSTSLAPEVHPVAHDIVQLKLGHLDWPLAETAGLELVDWDLLSFFKLHNFIISLQLSYTDLNL